MVRTTLPIRETEVAADGSVTVLRRKIKVAVDTSIYAEERWETFFPKNAERETLFAYIERIENSGLIGSPAHLLSNMKALFCFIESDELPDFKAFCRMFELSDVEESKRLIEKIKDVFEIALSGSASTAKN